MDFETINIEADALARRHDINPERVRRVFRKLAELNWFSPDFPFDTALDEAMGIISPQKALETFEREDLNSLALRVSLVEYLRAEETPFYCLRELAGLIDDFISHLFLNKASLINIGHPQSYYENSRWLDWHLNKLYFTKIPVYSSVIKPLAALDILLLDHFAPYSTTFDRDEQGILTYKYKWSVDRIKDISVDGAITDRGELARLCSYEEAPVIEGLSQKDAHFLQEIRQRVFDLKVDTLKRVQESLLRNDATTLWQDCLRIFREYLSYDEVQFLLRIDDFGASKYEFEEMTFSPYLNAFIAHNAGFTDLLEVVGHIEKEIDIGVMNKTRESILSLQIRTPISSYYEVLSEPWRDEFDSILDNFLQMESEEKDFWVEYRNRVNDALENEFDVEVKIAEKMKRKLAHKFEPAVTNYSKWIKSHLEAAEKAPPISFAGEAAQNKTSEYAFRREGEIWTVSFKGSRGRYRDSKGFRYIHLLLEHSSKEMHVLEMAYATEKPENSSPGKRYDQVIRNEPASSDLDIDGDIDLNEVLDKEALLELKRRLSAIETMLREAENNNDIGKIEKLQDEKNKIADYLAKSHGLGERKRKFKSPEEKARINIVRSIDRAIGKIRAVNGSLARHLTNSIRTGIYCCYSPDDDSIRWEL